MKSNILWLERFRKSIVIIFIYILYVLKNFLILIPIESHPRPRPKRSCHHPYLNSLCVENKTQDIFIEIQSNR